MQHTFCPHCGAKNPIVNGVKPKFCCACGSPLGVASGSFASVSFNEDEKDTSQIPTKMSVTIEGLEGISVDRDRSKGSRVISTGETLGSIIGSAPVGNAEANRVQSRKGAARDPKTVAEEYKRERCATSKMVDID